MGGKRTITVVLESRTDAIHLYIQSLLFQLGKKGFAVNLIVQNNSVFRNRYLNFALNFKNTFVLFFQIRKRGVVLFTDPLSLNLLTSLFIASKKFAFFYHYESDPFYYRFLPFVSYQKVLNNLDGLICISNFSRTQLTTLGVGSDKSQVIWGGVDHEVFKPSSLKTFEFDYILSNFLNYYYTAYKLCELLGETKYLQDFPMLKLVKAGKVSSSNREMTLKYVEHLNLVDNVIFLDYVAEHDLPALYSGAQLLLFPSLIEGLGMPILEAMACGCPVVTSNRSPMADLVDSDELTANPENPMDISNVCKRILSNELHRNTIIRKSLARSQQFTWDDTAQQVLEFMSTES